MALTKPLDQFSARWPSLGLALYVDDISLLARGTETYIKTVLCKAVTELEAAIIKVGGKLSRGTFGKIGGRSVVVAPLKNWPMPSPQGLWN